ncbi:hypothetical protein GMRT_13318 [Giardia muris]|uniref:Uncharacterized protein n=1 Tax=Giardia muris TaxID=5742 RepID=A0A4Z1T1N5_GIAMU|nr:hypothetical protein GMRT_13318 [Giardia muris]|eukprot:TNJ26281.1 hypothetical protein GMRT_13318 [Giardia muris]
METRVEQEGMSVHISLVPLPRSAVISVTEKAFDLGSITMMVPCQDTPGEMTSVSLFEDKPITIEMYLEEIAGRYGLQLCTNIILSEKAWMHIPLRQELMQRVEGLFTEAYGPHQTRKEASL